MKLTRVALEDFRCFGEATFDLTTPGSGKPLDVVLLVGGNGSGKSAFIQALAGLFTAVRPSYGGDRLGARDVRQGVRETRVEAGWVDWSTAGDGGRATFRSATILRTGGGAGEETSTVDVVDWLREVDVPRGPSGLILAFDVYRLLPPRRVSGPNVEHLLQHRCADALAPTIRRDGSMQPRAEDLKQWIVNLDYLRARSKADRGQELPLWEVLRHALDTLLRPYTFAGVDDAFQVLFDTPSGRVPIEALSDGFRSTFTIVSDLLLRLNLATIHPEQVLQQEAVCLIDEVDAHLHPRWQETIIPGLRALFPNVQFIATTHSPLVVASVEPENVFRLEAEGP
jgi:hypothetical protein